MDSGHTPAEKRSRMLANSRRYLGALSVDQPEQIRAAHKIVKELLDEIETRLSK